LWFNQNDLTNGLVNISTCSLGLMTARCGMMDCRSNHQISIPICAFQLEALANIATVLGLKMAKEWRQRLRVNPGDHRNPMGPRFRILLGSVWFDHQGAHSLTCFNADRKAAKSVPTCRPFNQRKFGRSVPTVAIDDQKYDPNQMERSHLVNVNYL
jgi:hypothetical protein